MTTLSRGASAPVTEGELVQLTITMLRDRLPPDWTITEVPRERGNPPVDAVLLLRSPVGGEVRVAVETKRLLEARDVSRVEQNLARSIDRERAGIGMVAARYLAKSTRQRLSESGLSYADATGNVLIRAESPALFISDRGADSDPWRGPGRPRGTLKGEPAAKVVRALLDVQGPWKIRTLIKASASSTGSVYRVVEFLEAEGLAVRADDGLITIPDWTALLRRWSEDYQFSQPNTITRWIAPRGVENFLGRVLEYETDDYVMTGSVAAATWAPYAPVRAAMIYSSNPENVAAACGLRPTDTGANVLLARPAYDVVFQRVIERPDGLRIAAPTQVAVDIMTGPGRAPAEAEELVDWMRRNEQLWR